MVVLKIIGWIVLILLLLLLLLLLLSVDLILQYDAAKGFQVKVRVWGMVFGGSKGAKKEKTEKEESGFVKAIKKQLGISHLGSMQEARETVEERGFAETVTDTAELLMLLLERVFWLVKRCRVPYCRITAVTGGEGAALDYGVACAVLYPLTAYQQEQMRLKQKRLRLDLRCDYGLEQGVFELDLAIRIRTVHALRAVLHILGQTIKKNVKEAERV